MKARLAKVLDKFAELNRTTPLSIRLFIGVVLLPFSFACSYAVSLARLNYMPTDLLSGIIVTVIISPAEWFIILSYYQDSMSQFKQGKDQPISMWGWSFFVLLMLGLTSTLWERNVFLGLCLGVSSAILALAWACLICYGKYVKYVKYRNKALRQ